MRAGISYHVSLFLRFCGLLVLVFECLFFAGQLVNLFFWLAAASVDPGQNVLQSAEQRCQEESKQRRDGLSEKRREKRKGKTRRDGVEGETSQKKERRFKGSERKALVSVWWFWGNLRPVGLLTQEVSLLRCRQLLRSSFFVDFA